MKQFFFMAGMQRSGATIISAILNQNPDIWVSPASPLYRMMVAQAQSHNELENIDYNRSDAIDNVLRSIPNTFYADKKAKYIIDKNLNWPSSTGAEVIFKYITQNIKFICPVRSVLDIITSFDTIINASPDSKNNIMDEQVLNQTYADKPLADRRADFLMRHDKDISLCLDFMKPALTPQFRHMFHFVEYDDFINDPEKEINNIYEYLEIPHFNHTFQNIFDKTDISPDSLTGIKDLHKIRPTISKVSRRPEDVLLPQTITKYSGLEFWRNI